MQKNAEIKHLSLQQLDQKLIKELQFCRTETERICARSFAAVDVRKRAYSLLKERSLTLEEIEIAKKYGYKPRS